MSSGDFWQRGLSNNEAWEQAKRTRAATEAALREALKPPAPVFQPLPKKPDAALRWLFFLYMPDMLR